MGPYMKTHNCTLHLILAALLSNMSIAQTAKPTFPVDTRDLKLEVTTPKTAYVTGDTIRFRVFLINVGTKAVYVAKSDASDGLISAGFSINVRKLSGASPAPNCPAEHHIVVIQMASPGQTAGEDIVRLAPNELVGLDWRALGCPLAPGTYQLMAQYSAENKKRELGIAPHDPEKVIWAGKVDAAPYVFRVFAKTKARPQNQKPTP